MVFSYIQPFDLEDIDVKQAATGGFHGTYMGKLAEGINTLEDQAGDDRESVDTMTYEENEDLVTRMHRKSSLQRQGSVYSDARENMYYSGSSDGSHSDGDDYGTGDGYRDNPDEEKPGIMRDPKRSSSSSFSIDSDDEENMVSKGTIT